MYTAKNYEHLLGLEGFSDTLLSNHFKLYNGYVNNTNMVDERLKSLAEEGNMGAGEYAELKRRFGWEFCGMRLHEYYFDGLNKEAKMLEGDSKLSEAIQKEYGLFENWKKDFIACGSMRGIGWVVLAYDRENERLFNVWVNEHDMGHFAGLEILLVMDVFEHAFISDYELDKKSYIESYFAAIDWSVVEKRFVK